MAFPVRKEPARVASAKEEAGGSGWGLDLDVPSIQSGCHGHGDSTAALGDAPRGSVAGTGVQPEDKQGPSRHPPPHGVPTMCTSGPGLRDF